MMMGFVRALRRSRSSYRTSFIMKKLHISYINHDGDGLNHISKRQSWRLKNKRQQLYPSRCPCCDTAIDSLHNCVVDHLSSAKHIAKIFKMFDIKDECRLNIVSMFTFPNQRQIHIKYGFKVDEILAAVADGIGQSFDGAKEQALVIPPERNWFVGFSMYLVGWNGIKKKGRKKKGRSVFL